MIATDVSDVLFGEPQPLRSRANLGVLKTDEVNIIVHGHEPTLSDVLVRGLRPELLAEARAKAPKASTWRRHLLPPPTRSSCGTAIPWPAFPPAGIGHPHRAVEGDAWWTSQCVFPAVAELQKCVHTKGRLDQAPKAKIPQHAPTSSSDEVATAMENARRRFVALPSRLSAA